MMTKREIVKWLELKKSEAIRKQAIEYERTLKEYKDNRAKETGCEEVIHEVTGLMAQANTIVNQWLRKVERDFPQYTTCNHYCNHLTSRTNLNEATVRMSLMLHFSDRDKNLATLKRLQDETEQNIIRTYCTVIANVRSQPTAKACIPYLKELGFDTTDLEETRDKPCVALAAPIDTRYLFIPKKEETV